MRLSTIIFIVLLNFLFGQSDYQKWLNKEKNDYLNYLSEDDKSFIEFLKKDWKIFGLNVHQIKNPSPKPLKIPKFDSPSLSESSKNIEVKLPVPKPIVLENKVEKQPDNASRKLLFFGKELVFPKTNKTKDFNVSNYSSKMFADFWKSQCTDENLKVIDCFNDIRQKNELGDWALISLVNKYSNEISDKNKTSELLLTWFYLSKLNYSVKIGYSGTELFVFIKSDDLIYRWPFMKTHDGSRFYAIDFSGNRKSIPNDIVSYDDFNKNGRKLNLILKTEKIIPNKLEKKEFVFDHSNIRYILPLIYDRNFVEYLSSFPKVEIEKYFNTEIENETKLLLLEACRKLVSNKSEIEALKLLLAFVQKAFEYKSDIEQFNKEKTFLIDEILHYNFSDCEDRAILFTFLVRELLKKEVIALDYPGHISVAVEMTDLINGDIIEYKKKRYLICDPTYINAPPGLAMDKYKDVKPDKIIEIN